MVAPRKPRRQRPPSRRLGPRLQALPQLAHAAEDVVGGLLLLLARARPEGERGLGVANGRAVADRDARELQPPPVACALRAVNRHRHDRRAALERKPPHARTRALADVLAARAPALGVDNDHPAPREDLERRLHPLFVTMTATYGEGAGVAYHPPEHSSEEL